MIPAIHFVGTTGVAISYLEFELCDFVFHVCNDSVLTCRDAVEVDNERKELEEV